MLTVDQWRRFRRFAGVLSAFGVAQFLILSYFAMCFYPGGSPFDDSSVGYSYFENPYSDLGRTVSWSGEDNSVSRRLFTGALILLSACVLPFYLCFPTHAPDKTAMLWVAAVLGIGSSLALIGVALTPYDTHFQQHHTMLFWWVLCILALSAVHFAILLMSRECGVGYAVVSLGLTIMTGLYLNQGVDLAMALVNRFAKEASLEPAIPMQKYLVAYLVFWFLVFSYKTHRLGDGDQSCSTSAFQRSDELAARHLAKLAQRRGRR